MLTQRPSTPNRRGERGVALISALVIAVALFGVGGASMMMARTDSMVSDNAEHGAVALWAATAGAEVGKNWLEFNVASTSFPTTIGPTNIGDGTYTVTVDEYDPGSADGRYELVSTGTGPDAASRTIRELVKVAAIDLDLDAVNIDGSGTHTHIEDGSGAPGVRVPGFSVDGRNHDENGNLSNVCPDTNALSGTSNNISTDLGPKIDQLKCGIVRRANDRCNMNGSNAGGTHCSYGLYWVGGSGPARRFVSTASCDPSAADCCKNLDLSAPELRATGIINNSVNPPEMVVPLPGDPNRRGPFMWDTPAVNTDPALLRTLTATDLVELQASVDEIMDFAVTRPIPDRECITGNITASGTYVYGTWEDAKITIISDPNHADPRMAALSNAPPCNGASATNVLDIKNNAIVYGTGILIVPRAIQFWDAEFHWQGIIVVLDDGDFRAKNAFACGAVYGAVVLQDDSGSDPKINFSAVEAETCPNPFSNTAATATTTGFSINYSCEAIRRALGGNVHTLSWVEDFGGD